MKIKVIDKKNSKKIKKSSKSASASASSSSLSLSSSSSASSSSSSSSSSASASVSVSASLLSSSSAASLSNINVYYNEVLKLKQTCPLWLSNTFFSSTTNHDDRMTEWLRIRILGKALLDKYSWSIPDSKSLNIISNFSPIIEIGAGNGYWCSLLQKMGVDIVAYDNNKNNSNNFTTVLFGDEKALKQKSNKNRNLFLCYPDEDYELSTRCLEHYEGEYIIHVGELFFGSKAKSSSQSPWGKSTTSEFQVLLMEEFHPVLVANLELTFPFTSDTISVWKRTIWVEGLEESDDDNDENDNDNDDDNLWAAIDNTEILPVDRCIGSLAHLLND